MDLERAGSTTQCCVKAVTKHVDDPFQAIIGNDDDDEGILE